MARRGTSDPARGRLRRVVPAGFVDVGATSAGTFLAGFYAASSLGPESLGAYAIFFSAFTLAMIVPAQLIFLPVEVASLQEPVDRRLAFVPQSLRLAAAPAAISLLAVLAAALVARRTVDPAMLGVLTAEAGAAALFAPLQDHLRRMLHLARRSWHAVVVSAARFVSIGIAIPALVASEVPAEWIPFGALAIGSGVACVVGLAVARAGSPGALATRLRFRALIRSGRWLLLVGALPTGVSFLAAGLVTSLDSVRSVGFAEAARVLAQPILVLALGLTAVLGPRAMEAGSRRDEAEARRISRLFVGFSLLVGGAYAALIGFAYSWSPLPQLVENAYAVAWLLPLSLAANLVHAVVFPYRAELTGAGKETRLAATEAVGNLVRIAIVLTAGLTHAYAIPAGWLALGSARWFGFRRDLRTMYGEAAHLPWRPGQGAGCRSVSAGGGASQRR